ncbi:AAA family ATPase [Amycolatopsis cihanbeyliensis]|uniref:Putative kinase n=1 Tax=Amycolatopsis cihanbeyliensis TaxID=1128664 RepID=A0A542DPS4_AMYCI|nr:AAA family ATPase [Amycolatopsis cihanbeyliensis]TQJ05092.1 putative kinase [Amycolatopsis cihanbeyliensis]
MMIAMAGLPGVGKTTLATALAAHLNAIVLNKDEVRVAHFGLHVEYTLEQDDFCVDLMYFTTAWLARKEPNTVVLIDGCTYTRAYQVDTLRQTATDLGQALFVIECDCDPELAIARLKEDLAAGQHPAANRTPELYWEFRAAAEPITTPKLLVDTARPVETSVEDCLRHLTVPTGAALA